MKKHLLLLLLAGILGSAFGCKVKEPRRDDGLFNTYVIRNAQLTPEIIEKYNFILPMDLSKTGYPDSYYTFLMPGTGEIIAINKTDLIKTLFPNAKEWKVNGKTVSEEEFYATPGQMLTLVTYYDGLLKAETRDNVNDDNPYIEEVNKESEAWYIENYGTPLPAEVALNDPETYFEDPNTIVTLDYVVTTPAKVKEADVKGYVIEMMGSNPMIHALTSEKHLDYFGGEGESMEAEVAAIEGPLTAANVAAYFQRAIEDLVMIKTDGKTVKAEFK